MSYAPNPQLVALLFDCLAFSDLCIVHRTMQRSENVKRSRVLKSNNTIPATSSVFRRSYFWRPLNTLLITIHFCLQTVKTTTIKLKQNQIATHFYLLPIDLISLFFRKCWSWHNSPLALILKTLLFVQILCEQICWNLDLEINIVTSHKNFFSLCRNIQIRGFHAKIFKLQKYWSGTQSCQADYLDQTKEIFLK